MSDLLDRDKFEPEGSESSYDVHTIEDENNIFQAEEELNYEPPAQEPSVFDQPIYRHNAYGNTNRETYNRTMQESKTATSAFDEEQKEKIVQPQYGAYHFTANQIQQDDLSLGGKGTDSESIHTEDTIEQEKTTAVPRKKKEKRNGGLGKKLLTCAAFAALFGLVAGGVFLGVAKIGGTVLGLDKMYNQPPVIGMVGSEPAPSDTKPEGGSVTADPGDVYSVAQVAQRCMPAMVGITNKSIQEVPSFFGFGSQNYESQSSGSGIIIGQTEHELLIATNHHVISGANTLTVCFVDDELVNAIVKGTDVDNDLAVISVQLSDIKEETLSQIKVIELGNSDDLQVGEQVVAIGNALGYGQSVSSGWVSALNREVVIEGTSLTLIQTDAAINPGNSGGALLNMKGQLIGINESKYADTAVEGMGYAIPISTATPILSNLMSRETRYKVDAENASYLGISCKDISAEFAQMYNVPTGVYIDSVVEGGPAAVAGLQKGDIITSFDGSKTASYSDLIGLLEYYAAGEIVEVVYYRTNNGVYAEQTTSIVLGARSESDLDNQNAQSQDAQNSQEQNEGSQDYFGNQGGGFDIFDFFGY